MNRGSNPQFTNLDLSDSVGQLGSCISAILAALGWTMRRHPYGTATFVRPNGEVYTIGPPALRAEVRSLLGPTPLLC